MQARTSLEAIVGKSHVLDDPTILDQYSADLSFVPRVRPKWVVKPSSTAEVQEIVKWANANSTPLVPVSSGSPHFRGDTIPGTGGAVIVDMSRMKRIIRIDPKNRVAMVEPGVTFAELQPALEKAGLSAYLPLCPRGSKSVIGSMLEREPITMPNHHWDSLDPLLCAEMVFGTGDILRSGEAAGPDTVEEQWEIGKAHINPTGPGQYDQARLVSAAQGTIGLVTWATLKCRPLSKVNRTFLVPSETIEPLIELSYRMGKARLGNNCFIVNDLNFACLYAQDPEEIRRLRETLPRWILVASFEGYGELPEEKVKYEEADFMEMLVGLGGLKALDAISGAFAEDVANLLSGPSAEPYWKLRYKGGCQETFFMTTMDQTPRFTDTMYDLAESCKYRGEDMGIYIQMMVQGTSCHCEFDLYYDPANQTEVDRTKGLVTRSSEELVKMGAFFSRPYGQWAKVAYAQAMGTTILQRKLKGIFDPNNILNPGKLCF
ncbi:MAG: FAD-binding oxidoreductase [Clostridia bacterium]|nr:FAD-binding oxidoreductase [Clostridia bacterium]